MEVERYIIDKSIEKRLEVTRWLGEETVLAGASGWFFEGAFKEILSNGGSFKLESLSGTAILKLQIPNRGFLPAPAANTEGIDGSFYHKRTKTLYVFQCTVSNRHPVKAMGIIRAIQSLVLKPDSVVLIFVLPDDNEQFQRQKIEFRYLHSLTPESDISIIHGVGPFMAEKLRKLNVSTIAQLRALVSRGNGHETYSSLISNLDRDMLLQVEYQFLAKIPQYKVVLSDVVKR
jgi:hypothetical protein